MNPQRFVPARGILLALTVVLAFTAGPAVAAPTAAAAQCPDAEVLWARGTAETAAPIGVTGLVFGEQLRSRLPGKTVRVTAVDYPASSDFGNRPMIAKSVNDGVRDARNRIRRIARECPDTRIVLGGYSQGAAVVGFTTSDGIDIPAAYARYADLVPHPLPADVASHVAAVVLLGPPSGRFLRDGGAPPMRVGAAYRNKTVSLCAPGDNICDGSPAATPTAQHLLYPVNGMTDQAAAFAARRI